MQVVDSSLRTTRGVQQQQQQQQQQQRLLGSGANQRRPRIRQY